MVKKSTLYTKGGDKGETSLVDGMRISKGDVLLEAYGEVDELNAYLGIIISLMQGSSLEEFLDEREFILSIQNRLFVLGSNLACRAEKRREFQLEELSARDLEMLEKRIDFLDEKLPKLKNFILPGGDLLASHFHVSRTICRRVERRISTLTEDQQGLFSLKYINRLSDYFFVTARFVNLMTQTDEIIWSS